jgi:pyridoxine 5-phosphate synthase
LFIDAEAKQIEASAKTGAKFIELHTGTYANAKNEEELKRELKVLSDGGELAIKSGLRLNSGHGLTYWNTRAIAQIAGMEELNIGHSIISRAVLVGLDRAIREMKELII